MPEINETLKGSFTMFLGTVRQKISTKNLDTTPLLIQTFSVPEINATVKDSPKEVFGTVRQKKFRRKVLILSPPSYP